MFGVWEAVGVRFVFSSSRSAKGNKATIVSGIESLVSFSTQLSCIILNSKTADWELEGQGAAWVRYG